MAVCSRVRGRVVVVVHMVVVAVVGGSVRSAQHHRTDGLSS